jgi:hypothetical protein
VSAPGDPLDPRPGEQHDAHGAEPLLEVDVTDPEGRVVAGITLTATFARRYHSYSNVMYVGIETGCTDDSGRFRLEVPPRAEWATIVFGAPDWVQPPMRRVAGPPWRRQSIVLARGTPVAGVVETPAGVRLADFPVRAIWSDGPEGAGSAVVYTNAHGGFSIVVPAEVFLRAFGGPEGSVLPAGLPPWEAREASYASILTRDAEARAGPIAPGTSNICMVVRDTVPLPVHLEGPDGPLTGRVILRVVDLAWPILGSFVDDSYVHDGEVTWHDPERERHFLPGAYEIELVPEDPECLPARVLATLPCDRIEVRCERAARIEGLLDGTDPGDFRITWDGPGNERCRTMRTETGDFVLRGIGDGAGDVYARREGDPRCAFAPACRPGHGFLRLTLAPGGTICGRVETPGGRDPAWLGVRAVRGALDQRAAVGRDGTFSIVGLPPGAFRVELLDSWQEVCGAVDGVQAGAEDVILRLSPGKAASGQ